jgi:L-cystine transport system substrate-binding protein
MKEKSLPLLLSFVLLTILFAAGCQTQLAGVEQPAQQDPGETTASSPIPANELVESGVLTIATTGNAKPFTLVGDDGNLQGYDIDICTEMAQRLGLRPNFVVLEWAGILPGLAANRFDIVCTGVGRTPERLAAPDFLFGAATVQDGTGLVVRADNNQIHSWADARGMKMGGVRGAYYSSDVSQLFDGDVQLTEYPGETELFLDLQNGRIDFATMGYLVAAVRSTENPNLRLVDEPINPIPKGIPVNKNAPTLLANVDRLIAEFTETGQLEEWQIKWFGIPALPEGE